MSEILNAAYVIVAVVLLFGAAVFVHEFGHFWMFENRVEKFYNIYTICFSLRIFAGKKQIFPELH